MNTKKRLPYTVCELRLAAQSAQIDEYYRELMAWAAEELDRREEQINESLPGKPISDFIKAMGL